MKYLNLLYLQNCLFMSQSETNLFCWFKTLGWQPQLSNLIQSLIYPLLIHKSMALNQLNIIVSRTGVILFKKKMTKWIFPKYYTIWKMFSDSKQVIRKPKYCKSRFEARWERNFKKCATLKLIWNIFPFLIVVTSLFQK